MNFFCLNKICSSQNKYLQNPTSKTRKLQITVQKMHNFLYRRVERILTIFVFVYSFGRIENGTLSFINKVLGFHKLDIEKCFSFYLTKESRNEINCTVTEDKCWAKSFLKIEHSKHWANYESYLVWTVVFKKTHRLRIIICTTKNTITDDKQIVNSKCIEQLPIHVIFHNFESIIET